MITDDELIWVHDSAPQSKNAVCALQITCKLLPFPWKNPAEMSR